MKDGYEIFYSCIDEMAAAIREFADFFARKIAEAVEELGEWIDYDKPVYPTYVPVGSFRPLVIHQRTYTSGFL